MVEQPVKIWVTNETKKADTGSVCPFVTPSTRYIRRDVFDKVFLMFKALVETFGDEPGFSPGTETWEQSILNPSIKLIADTEKKL